MTPPIYVPAQPGQEAILVTVINDAGFPPRAEQIRVDRAPVVAWLMRQSSDGAQVVHVADPVFPDGADIYGANMLITMNEGRVYCCENGFVFDSLDAALAELLTQAVEAFDRQQAAAA